MPWLAQRMAKSCLTRATTSSTAFRTARNPSCGRGNPCMSARGLAPADQGVAARSRPDLTADLFDARSGVWGGGRLTEEGECGA